MIVLNDKKIDYPPSVSWIENPTWCPKATDFTPRHTWIRGIVVHTVNGVKGPLKPGTKDTGRDFNYARYFANTTRKVSCDYIMDCDGSIAVTNDPLKNFTWHAESVNPVTLGIEFVQDDKDGALYEGQIAAGVRFIAFLCEQLGIQKQVPAIGGNPDPQVLTRLKAPNDGHTLVGVYGHRNQTTNRGFGDPGNWIFEALLRNGFEGFNFQKDEDLMVWKDRQKNAGIEEKDCDGIPGPFTRKKLEAQGYKNGIWMDGR
jgi:N-acetylmuramoyl-L-alanine amidase